MMCLPRDSFPLLPSDLTSKWWWRCLCFPLRSLHVCYLCCVSCVSLSLWFSFWLFIPFFNFWFLPFFRHLLFSFRLYKHRLLQDHHYRWMRVLIVSTDIKRWEIPMALTLTYLVLRNRLMTSRDWITSKYGIWDVPWKKKKEETTR